MRRKTLISCATLLALVVGQSAQADYIYQFTTIPPTGIGGSLSATITAPDSAISTGSISAADITSLQLQLSGTSLPFVDGTTTATGALIGSFSVNTTTGDFISTRPELFAAIPPETVTLSPSLSDIANYIVQIPDVGQTGEGIWSVKHSGVPEPSTVLLAGIGGLIGLAVAVRCRCRRWEARVPAGRNPPLA
ncbi:MAG TPA: PEP-CTERM sorting domain-containing protein [Gemmataceae bacterium]|nr:PEP-CTERM sorting domain-containing protein [Gemmataceae bacterium]